MRCEVQNYVLYRSTTGVRGWIVIWGSSLWKCASGSKEMREGYLDAASFEEGEIIRQCFFQKFSD